MHTQRKRVLGSGALGILLALGAAAGAVSCGEDPCDAPPCATLPDLGQPQDGGAADAAPGDGTVGDTTTAGDAEAGGEDGTSQRAPMGVACASSPECLSGLCFKPPGGARFCTMRCFGPCPPGFDCQPVSATQICVVSTACQPDCEGKPCGDDGCGGSCGVCPEGLECVPGADGAPLCAVPKSPLGTPCTQGSTCASGTCAALTPGGELVCAQPCDLLCPAGMRCDPTLAGQAGVPGGAAGLCAPAACQRSCQDRACGDDGCGGSCGACPSGGVCDGGSCRELTCEDVPEVGCCVGDMLHTCADGALVEQDCGAEPHCGWNPVFARYLCHSNDESDPQGLLPRTCGVDPSGGGMECAAWVQCAAGCPEGDLWCGQACRDKTVATARPLVDAVTSCNAASSCAWSEPCIAAHCPSSWAECVATAAP